MLEDSLHDIVSGRLAVHKEHALHRGWLLKQGAKGVKTFKRRFFCLFSGGALVYFKTEREARPQGGLSVEAYETELELKGDVLSVTARVSFTARSDLVEGDAASRLCVCVCVCVCVRVQSVAINDSCWQSCCYA
jgi:hypothetical protein